MKTLEEDNTKYKSKLAKEMKTKICETDNDSHDARIIECISIIN